MAYNKRTVSFFRLILEKQIDGHKEILTKKQTEECFQKIYNTRMVSLESGNKAANVTTNGNAYVVEVVEYSNHQLFGKIGKQNGADTVALRDQQTLETEEVPMTDTQALELYTYFLLDFETGIISYIGIGGSPKISAIRGLFDFGLMEEGILSRIAAIMTHDILNTVMRKRVISKLEVTVAVPSDAVLGEQLGLPRSDFDDICNVQARTATFKIVANRNRNFLRSNSKLGDLVAAVHEKFGDRLLKLSVSAKDDGETTQPYNLLEYCFAKTVPLGTNDQVVLKLEDYRSALYLTYNRNKEELQRYIR